VPPVPRHVAGLLLLAGALIGLQPGLATTVTLTLGALLVTLLVSRTAPTSVAVLLPAGRRRPGRTARTPFLRQSDPDGAGRPRPRAPAHS
jgi:hypothetical protein